MNGRKHYGENFTRGSATTTEAIRRAIQNSKEGLRALSKRYGIDQKTVAKWEKRTSVSDHPTGSKEASSTVLTIEEKAIIVATHLKVHLAAASLLKKEVFPAASDE